MSSAHANPSRPTFSQLYVQMHGEPVRMQEECNHESAVHDSPSSVPFLFCQHCESLVLSKTPHSVVAKTLPLPKSMLRDKRFKDLIEIYNDHVNTLQQINKLVQTQEKLLLRSARWATTYSKTGALVDYSAQNHPLYATLDSSINRVNNLLRAFQQTADQIISDVRKKFWKEANRAVPLTEDSFVQNTKRLICASRKTAMLHPHAGKDCVLCDSAKCYVAMHASDDCRHSSIANLLIEAGIVSADSQTRRCSCHEFSVCIDCLLKWYWENSNQLQKSFAQCPLCRGEFHLEDIVPIHSGEGTAHSAQYFFQEEQQQDREQVQEQQEQQLRQQGQQSEQDRNGEQHDEHEEQNNSTTSQQEQLQNFLFAINQMGQIQEMLSQFNQSDENTQEQQHSEAGESENSESAQNDAN